MNCNDICFYKQEEERLSVNEFFLLLACEEGHKEWIQWICHYDINIDLSMRNFLPLQTACQTNNTETMLYLIKRHPDAITSIKEYIYEQIMNYNVNMITSVYQEFPTIFHLFTSNEFIEILYVLCEINMKLAYWFCDKFPFIHVIRDNHRLFINAYLSENLEIIKLLNIMQPDCYHINIIHDKLQCFDIDYNINPGNTIKKRLLEIEHCYICYEDNADILTSCNHFYCTGCIQKHYEYNNIQCPYCRMENYENQLFLIESV